jgi:hypothetical protein
MDSNLFEAFSPRWRWLSRFFIQLFFGNWRSYDFFLEFFFILLK